MYYNCEQGGGFESQIVVNQDGISSWTFFCGGAGIIHPAVGFRDIATRSCTENDTWGLHDVI